MSSLIAPFRSFTYILACSKGLFLLPLCTFFPIFNLLADLLWNEATEKIYTYPRYIFNILVQLCDGEFSATPIRKAIVITENGRGRDGRDVDWRIEDLLCRV